MSLYLRLQRHFGPP